MSDREELDALRRMAELEAKAGNVEPTTPIPQVQPEKTWDQKMGQRLGKIGSELSEPQGNVMGIPNVPNPAHIAGQVAGMGSDTIGSVLSSAYDWAMPKKAKEGISNLISDATAEGTPIGEAVRWWMPKVEKVKQYYPEVWKYAEDAANIGQFLPFGKTASDVSTAVTQIKHAGKTGILDDLKADTAKRFAKVAKIPTRAKATDPLLQQYNSKAADAMIGMAQDKSSLGLVDPILGPIARNPETLAELSTGTKNKMKGVWDKIVGLQAQAGESGYIAPLDDVYDELSKIVKSKSAKTVSGETVNYADQTIKNIVEQYPQGMTIPDMQDMIGRLNVKTANGAIIPTGQAEVDSAMVKILRKKLDDAVDTYAGPGHRALKDEYTSLKAVEKGITHAAAKEAEKKSSMNFLDIISSAGTLHALTSGGSTVPYLALEAGNTVRKMLNDPQKNMIKMFNHIDKKLAVIDDLKGGFKPKSMVGKKLSPYIQNLIDEKAKTP